MTLHLYSIRFHREYPGTDLPEYAVLLVQAESYFAAENKAEEELAKPHWINNGWTLSNIEHIERKELDAGKVVCLMIL